MKNANLNEFLSEINGILNEAEIDHELVDFVFQQTTLNPADCHEIDDEFQKHSGEVYNFISTYYDYIKCQIHGNIGTESFSAIKKCLTDLQKHNPEYSSVFIKNSSNFVILF